MEINVLKLMEELMNTQEIEAHLFRPPYENIKNFEGGIRKQLYEGYDYNVIIEQLEHNCKENKLYMVIDQFEVHYIMFKFPDSISGTESAEFFSIGPYILDTDIYEVSEIAERNQLPIYSVSELQEYYYGIPVIAAKDTLESITFLLMQYILGGNNFQIDLTGINLKEENHSFVYKISHENNLSMAIIEERYRCEDEMLEPVEQGDLTKALMCMNVFNKYRVQPRSTDSLRDYKNMMIVLNVLFRTAVQKSKVHPAHIDHISASLAKRIESSGNKNELTKIMNEMIRKYCFLVQNHSLRGYS